MTPRTLVILVALVGVARADDTVARVSFQRAQELIKENPPRWAEACALYEASFRADTQIGVLLYLADCYEHIGRYASAWSSFNDAADLAKRRGDNRETIAHDRAVALAPKLSKLALVAPAGVPQLVVTRDGADVTVLLGTEMAIDPGTHHIVASAPGYAAWAHDVAIAAPGVTQLPIPPLEKLPQPEAAPPAPVAVQRGAVMVRSQPDAEIWIDAQRVGTGSYHGSLKVGGHTLRVVAPGMQLYQSELVVTADDSRTVDVPLSPVVATAPTESLPHFELAASFAPGIKLANDDPFVIGLRVETALRIGRRVNLGVYAEYARVQTSGTCGTAFAGPDPATPFDYGPRNQFTNCSHILPGVQLYVHVAPRRRWDPYIGISPGFRFGTLAYTTYFDGMAVGTHDRTMYAIMLPVRAGVTFHPTHGPWTLGGYVESAIQLIGDAEDPDQDSSSKGIVTMFTGFRSTVLF
jgi:hypothetical protein